MYNTCSKIKDPINYDFVYFLFISCHENCLNYSWHREREREREINMGERERETLTWGRGREIEALDSENSNSESVPNIFTIVLKVYYVSFTLG